MPPLKKQVAWIIQNVIEETQALPNSEAAKAMADLIIFDLIRPGNLEVVQAFLSEQVEVDAAACTCAASIIGIGLHDISCPMYRGNHKTTGAK